jgi:hypothetical protein
VLPSTDKGGAGRVVGVKLYNPGTYRGTLGLGAVYFIVTGGNVTQSAKRTGKNPDVGPAIYQAPVRQVIQGSVRGILTGGMNRLRGTDGVTNTMECTGRDG